MASRNENVFMAKVAEQAERYEDMVEYMKRVAEVGSELTVEERNLLSQAFKNAVGARRQAWRAVNTVQAKEERKGPEFTALIDRYRRRVERELNRFCNDALIILDDLIDHTAEPEPKVFYLKLKGDYKRYLAEFGKGDDHRRNSQEAHDAYSQSSEIAHYQLPATNPHRLGLALNLSVFYYEVFSSPEKACTLAKTAFDDAMAVMDGMTEDEYQDSTQIMQMLRDNLALWTGNMRREEFQPRP